MTKEQSCIKEMYELLDKIESNARKHDFSLLRARSQVSGCNMFQGTPPITRIIANWFDKYDDVIYQAMKESEKNNG